jgi:hypothetical protein
MGHPALPGFPLLTAWPRLKSAARLVARGHKLAGNGGNIFDLSRLQVDEFDSAIPMDAALRW